jgi:hypothetical protein
MPLSNEPPRTSSYAKFSTYTGKFTLYSIHVPLFVYYNVPGRMSRGKFWDAYISTLDTRRVPTF